MPINGPASESSAEEIARLRRRVAELEAELGSRDTGSPAPGNNSPLALKMLAVETPLVVVSVALVNWVNAGQLQSSGWPELAFIAGLLLCLATPIAVCAVNVLVVNLGAAAMGPRLLTAGSLAVVAWLGILLQWWLIDMDGLNLFAGGALLMLFLPAMAFRLLSKWRLRMANDPVGARHATPRTLDLLLLTGVFASGIAVIRYYAEVEDLDLGSGYIWWLLTINSLLPATVVCVGCYCSLRMAAGPNRWAWFAATVVASLLAGIALTLQMLSMGFTSWEAENWPDIVSLPIDMTVVICSIAAPLAIIPLLIVWPWRHPVADSPVADRGVTDLSSQPAAGA